MRLPIIDISFKKLAKTVVTRSSRGIVALILKGSKHSIFEVVGESEIPPTLSEANQNLIKEVLKGNDYLPNKVMVYVLADEGNLSDALTYFESCEFNTICMPGAEVSDNTELENFITKMKNIVKYRVCGVLYNKTSNNYEIINLTAKNITLGGETVGSDLVVARLAGLIEGTPLSKSITYATLEYDGVETLTKEDADFRIENGEVIFIKEMGKIRVARGVTSMTTNDKDTQDAFKNLQTVRILNLIHNDLRKVIVERYIGKTPNNYDNKCILITEIKEYLEELEKEQLIENISYVGIDIQAQTKWLKENTNLDVVNMMEDEIKAANTGTNVFLAISLKVVNAMEDVKIAIEI